MQLMHDKDMAKREPNPEPQPGTEAATQGQADVGTTASGLGAGETASGPAGVASPGSFVTGCPPPNPTTTQSAEAAARAAEREKAEARRREFEQHFLDDHATDEHKFIPCLIGNCGEMFALTSQRNVHMDENHER